MTATIIVGGGLSGLVRGHLLAGRGRDVRVLEATDRVGGAARTEKVEGYLLELGPNTVRPTPEIWDLVLELGLKESALLADPRLPRYIEFEGTLHELAPGPQTLVKTRLLSTAGKFRLLREPFVARGSDPQETVHDFFSRRLGPQVAERLVAPFVSGIWAGDAKALSASASFPRLFAWERQHGSLVRGAFASRPRAPQKAAPKTRIPKGLLSFREGMETLPRALEARLGSRLKTGCRVNAIRQAARGFRVETDREVLEADEVVVATPAGDAARLLEPLDPEAARALAAIPQPPLAVLHLSWPVEAFPRPLRGFGHLVVPSSGRRVLGAVWSSSLFPSRAPAGQTLLTVFIGGARDPGAAHLPDEALADLAARDLSAVLGVRDAPRIVRVTRYARAIPQYDREHDSRMKALEQAEARSKGLTFIGNYRGGISVGDVVRNAAAVAEAEA